MTAFSILVERGNGRSLREEALGFTHMQEFHQPPVNHDDRAALRRRSAMSRGQPARTIEFHVGRRIGHIGTGDLFGVDQ